MNLAFYAPMKPPDHPAPSGDRLIANLLLAALRRAGYTPFVASRFRSYEGRGDPARQRRLRGIGERLGQRLLRRLQSLEAHDRPRCFFTYHLYHKAPDWIGPTVSRALGIPYVVAESSVAPKQAEGPWSEGFAAATRAIAEADLVMALGSHDLPCLRSVVADPNRLVHLKPFLDLSDFNGARGEPAARVRPPADLPAPAGVPRLITVAMMRAGHKLASYRVLAKALARLAHLPWHLVVVGDGPARPQVEAAFAEHAAHRVSFLGLRSRAEVSALLGAGDLFVWPAVAEALGMAMLEAHAAGLPVVAGRSGGVADIVQDGGTGRLTPPGDADAFAAAVAELLADAETRRALGETARQRVASVHGIDAAGAALGGWLHPLTRPDPAS